MSVTVTTTALESGLKTTDIELRISIPSNTPFIELAAALAQFTTRLNGACAYVPRPRERGYFHITTPTPTLEPHA